MTPQHKHTPGAGSLPLLLIGIGDRLRKDTPQDRLEIERDIVPSIAEHGLIHPILVSRHEKPVLLRNVSGEEVWTEWELVAGWSRLVSFNLLQYPEIPYNYRDAIPEDEREALELEENIRRRSMRWQDETLAIQRIFNKKMALVPESERSKVEWGQRQTGYMLGVEAASVKYTLIIAQYLVREDKEVMEAQTPAEAMRIITKRREDEVLKALHDKESANHISTKKLAAMAKKAERNAVPSLDGKPQIKFVAPAQPKDERKVTQVQLYSRIRNMDCFDYLATVDDGFFDLCYTDPPFAIPMDSLENRADIDVVRASHQVGENLDQMKRFFSTLYPKMAENSYALVYYDIRHQEKLFGAEQWQGGEWKYKKGWAEKAGFKVQPFPLIWVKTHGVKNNAAGQHWPKSFEYVMVLRKGTPTLAEVQQVGHKEGSNTADRKLQKNPFAKSWAFSEWALRPIAKPGMRALDCYAGGGSMVRHMLNMGLDVYATEKDPEQFPHLIESVKQWHENATHGKLEFV